MANDRLEPGGRPKKRYLQPEKGRDGIWRLDRIRHRTYSGAYTRTSATGRTKTECLDQWEERFEENRNKGSVRIGRSDLARIRFTRDDKMIDIFDHFLKVTDKRVKKGEVKSQTYDTYHRMIYVCGGPNSVDDAVKLEKELGHLTAGEVADTSFLIDYLDDIAELAPGIAGQHYTILTAVFKMLTLIGPFKYNPMAPVQNPYLSGGTQRALTSAERDTLFELFTTRAPRTKYRRVLFLLLLGTGLRIGEALALRWVDVDLREGSECAVIHVCGTVVKPTGGSGSFRQDKRKNTGRPYYLTLPLWLTRELREWRSQAEGVEETDHVMFSNQGPFVAVSTAENLLLRIVKGTSMEWVQYGNFRDTVATHVVGKTGDKLSASAQLGHAEGSTVASVHYIDGNGYIHPAVDYAAELESLKPSKLEQKWNNVAA